ncbi:MAG: FGGY family carbohydrate kinase [Actinomycetota bacterium]|nr:FGGY family carbohydrate kinase [Actinomycetota bacterium]
MNGRRRDAVLGVDLGTGSIKAVAFTPDRLEVEARASVPVGISAPRAGWVEADPQEWLEATGRAVLACLERCGNPSVLGVGLSGQMHGVVLCREDGTPARPAVLWADTRSSEQTDILRAGPPDLRARLANPLVTGMAGPTLGWIGQHERDVLERSRWALQAKDWLRLVTTGEATTEPSDASATLLWDLPGDRWCEDAFDLLRIPRRLVPPVGESAAFAGKAAGDRAPRVLPASVPLVHGGADTACALFGTDPLTPGAVQISVGTGAQVVADLRSPQVDPSGRTHLYRGVLPGSWYAMGAVQNAGLAFEQAWRWLGVTWDEAYRLFVQAPPGSGGVTFVPHLSGERTPYVDSTLRGGWLGLGLEHTRSHFVRSVLEGVAFAIREAVEALRSAGHKVEQARLVGGGSRHRMWRRLLADVLQLPLTVIGRPDASARGAARLACLGLDIGVDAAPTDVEEVVEPSGTTYEDAFALFRARVPIHVS